MSGQRQLRAERRAKGSLPKQEPASGSRLRSARASSQYALVAAFASALALMLIPLIGPTGVVLFLASGGVLALATWRQNVVTLGKFSPLLAFPALAIVSTIWSDAPHATMRAGLQLLLTFCISILIAANLPARRLLVALFLGCIAQCASALPNVPGALATRIPLASEMLGSKNQLGFSAFLLFATAIAIGVDRKQHWVARIAALISAPTALWIAYEARSGGATVSILLTLFLFPPLAYLAALQPRGRTILSGLAVMAFALALLFHQLIDEKVSAFRSEVLEKNETLTGRTHLWDVADQLWRQRPLLGHGFSAFWQHGNLEAEALWRWGGIATRSGFNFHSVIAETKVGLGSIGVAVLLLTCTAIAIVALWRQLKAPTVTGAYLLATSLVLYARSTVENGLVSEFSGSTMLLLATGIYSLREKLGPAQGVRRAKPARRS